MKIKIIEIKDSLVRFNSESGNGFAKWNGEKPLHNYTYDVEVDINDKFVWGQNITKTDATYGMTWDDCYNIIAVAKVVAYEEDGCLSVKLNGSVILLEVENVPKNVSGYVNFKAKDITLFPINL